MSEEEYTKSKSSSSSWTSLDSEEDSSETDCKKKELSCERLSKSLKVEEETQAERNYYNNLLDMEDLSAEDRDYCEKILVEIGKVRRQMDNLFLRLEKFRGVKGDKEYVFLEENMISCTLKLDSLDAKGFECIRAERKRVVINIQNCMRYLDNMTKQSKQGSDEGLEVSAT